MTCNATPVSPVGESSLRALRSDARFIEAVAERIRAVVCRDPHHTLDAAAEKLDVPADSLRALLNDHRPSIDLDLALDVVAALVHECGVDPTWLLTGQYDGGIHREALMLGDDRSATGRHHVRDFVSAQYSRLREKRFYLTLPPTLEALRVKVASLLNPR